MIDTVYIGISIFLLLNILVGSARTLKGPGLTDRIMTAQLFGTLGVAILLVLAQLLDRPALRDVGLLFALLGAVAVVAFISHAWRPAEPEESA